MPAHLKFINVLLVPLNSALLSAQALKNRVTDGPGSKELVSPAEVYKGLKSLAGQRETSCKSYRHDRECMDASDPSKPNPRFAVPQEDWGLYFRSATAFNSAVERYYDECGTKPDHDLMLILYPKDDILKRIEVIAPELSRPSIIWIDGKGAFPNATG